jgi:rhodanese-related sulfurtransferase
VLIDVRTHEETLFNGVASPMHRHIPYVIADFDHSYDTERERYRLEPNPYFPRSVDELLAEMKLDREATIILYCSVGERSARAANLLIQSGFKSVYSMVEGFEGDPASGIGAGWKAAGLPWTQRLRRDQAYKNPAM